MKREKPWNRCDFCGRFISIEAFESGSATRKFWVAQNKCSIDPDPVEHFENECADCKKGRHD